MAIEACKSLKTISNVVAARRAAQRIAKNKSVPARYWQCGVCKGYHVSGLTADSKELVRG